MHSTATVTHGHGTTFWGPGQASERQPKVFHFACFLPFFPGTCRRMQPNFWMKVSPRTPGVIPPFSTIHRPWSTGMLKGKAGRTNELRVRGMDRSARVPLPSYNIHSRRRSINLLYKIIKYCRRSVLVDL
jgi:hypothetical protein